MIYEQKPENFSPKFEVVSCFLEHNGEILLLHRQNHKPQGDTWGVPAGKVDEGESVMTSLQREAWEETGVKLDSEKIKHFKKIFVRYDDYDFSYHIFHTKFENKPEVEIREEEHKGFQWLSPKDAMKINLIQDLDACIEMFYTD